jgi:tRNA (guanine-N1)-methyltransferase
VSGPTFEIFTLFPDAIAGFLRGGLVGKAVEQGRVAVHCTDFRAYATDRYGTVDDAPYGGGPGVVIKPEPVVAALEAVTAARGPMHRVLLTPTAPRFDQRVARRLATYPRIALLCGRYEGIDDRVREGHVDECLSLGDFVLNGGEIAALAILESVARLCEGVLGNPESAAQDSFSGDAHAWLECPQYTRPPDFRGRVVPTVLLAGNHADVARWRAQQAWARTWALRPDLRPSHRLPADAAIYALVEPVPADSSARAANIKLIALAGPPVHEHAHRDLKAVRRLLRRRHGKDPHFVGVVADAASEALPVATSAPALLDLLALGGDLSAPLVLLTKATAARLTSGGDLTNAPQAPVNWPAGVAAVLAVAPATAPAPAFQLAESATMSDSPTPNPAPDLVEAALSQLRPAPERP